jgi:iron complex outermembrane receptor protein
MSSTPTGALTVSVMQQELDADGVFFQDPELDDWEIQRYAPDTLTDEFTNFAWTLEGRLAMLDVVYTGAYTDRESDQVVDYTDYMFVGQYFPYYTCDGSVTYPGAADPSGVCSVAGVRSWTPSPNTTVESHEFRFNTPQDRLARDRRRVLFLHGLEERNDFTYPAPSRPIRLARSRRTSRSHRLYLRSRSVPGWRDLPQRRPAHRRPVRRVRRGDLRPHPDFLHRDAGARYYDIEGGPGRQRPTRPSVTPAAAMPTRSAPTSPTFITATASSPSGARATPAATSPITTPSRWRISLAIDPLLSQAQAEQIFNADPRARCGATDGVIFKLTGTWTPTDRTLFYATYSEGFRPGLLNRPGGAPGRMALSCRSSSIPTK